VVVRVTLNVDRALKVLEAVPPRLERRLKAAFVQVGETHLRRMKERVSNDALRRRSGLLGRSFQKRVESDGTLSGLRMRVYSAGVPYANIHEFGGTIRPTPPRRFLTIPTDDNIAQGARNLPKEMSARALMDDPTRNTFIFKTSKAAYVAERMPNGELMIWFLLKSSVRIPPRLGWFDTWHAARAERLAIFENALRGAAGDAAGGGAGVPA